MCNEFINSAPFLLVFSLVSNIAEHQTETLRLLVHEVKLIPSVDIREFIWMWKRGPWNHCNVPKYLLSSSYTRYYLKASKRPNRLLLLLLLFICFQVWNGSHRHATKSAKGWLTSSVVRSSEQWKFQVPPPHTLPVQNDWVCHTLPIRLSDHTLPIYRYIWPHLTKLIIYPISY